MLNTNKVPINYVDTRIGIFKQKFQCKLRYIDTLSEAEIRMCGVPTTYSEELDEALLNQPITQWLTINEMLELYRKGITIAVSDYDDTKKIYDNIQAHLLAWRDDIVSSHTTRHVPFTDLIDLDRFAAVVYKKAKFVFDIEKVDDTFVRGLDNVFGIASLFSNPEDLPEIKNGKRVIKDRFSLEELFINSR